MNMARWHGLVVTRWSWST